MAWHVINQIKEARGYKVKRLTNCILWSLIADVAVAASWPMRAGGCVKKKKTVPVLRPDEGEGGVLEERRPLWDCRWFSGL